MFVAEALLFAGVLGAIGLALFRKVGVLRGHLATAQRALPASRVPAELARLQAAREREVDQPGA